MAKTSNLLSCQAFSMKAYECQFCGRSTFFICGSVYDQDRDRLADYNSYLKFEGTRILPLDIFLTAKAVDGQQERKNAVTLLLSIKGKDIKWQFGSKVGKGANGADGFQLSVEKVKNSPFRRLISKIANIIIEADPYIRPFLEGFPIQPK